MSLEEAVEAHKAFTGLQCQTAQAQEARNAAVIKAHQEGITAYRIAKALGVAESTIGRIVKAQITKTPLTNYEVAEVAGAIAERRRHWEQLGGNS